MTPEVLARIREWDAKCTWPEQCMFGTTIDRRRLIEYVDELLSALADAKDDSERWHKAFMDGKYPGMVPLRVDLERRIKELEAAQRIIAPEREPPHCPTCECAAR